MRAKIRPLPEPLDQSIEVEAHVSRVRDLVDRALSLATGLSPDLRSLVGAIDKPVRLVYLIASLLDMKPRTHEKPLENLKGHLGEFCSLD